MVTTANVTDRNGAMDMVDYYCDVTNHLSMLKKILVDGGYTGKNLPTPFTLFLVQMLRLLSAMSSTRLLSFQNAGSLSAPSPGLINVADFGKTASAIYKTRFKCFRLLLFACS